MGFPPQIKLTPINGELFKEYILLLKQEKTYKTHLGQPLKSVSLL